MTKFAVTPTQGSNFSAGVNLYSAHDHVIPPRNQVKCFTDIQVKFPKNTYGRLISRSESTNQEKLEVGTGVIDPDFTGNLTVLLHNQSDSTVFVSRGDPIAQLICESYVPVKIQEVTDVLPTKRGTRGTKSETPKTKKKPKSKQNLSRSKSLANFSRQTNSTAPSSKWKFPISKIPTSLFVILLFAFLPLTIGQNFSVQVDKYAETQTYFRCGRSRSGHAIGIPKSISCKPPDQTLQEPIKQARVEIWTPREKPAFSDAAKCFRRKITVCTYNSWLFSKSILSHESVILPVTADVCFSAWRYRIYEQLTLKQIQPGVWTTNNTVVPKFKYCCYEVCTPTTNFFLEEGQIATMDGIRLSTDLGDISPCFAQKSSQCLIQNYRYVWNSEKLKYFCPMVQKGFFNATIFGDHLIVDQLQTAFAKIDSIFHLTCVPPKSFLTNQGAAIKILKYFTVIPNKSITHQPYRFQTEQTFHRKRSR